MMKTCEFFTIKKSSALLDQREVNGMKKLREGKDSVVGRFRHAAGERHVLVLFTCVVST